ncbi:hypothetical protein [Spongiactinospora sp. 9N601]|uniref:hypothetical protein n=1 Tax=Spongiactinospora sp. 9N601 TaxID=3375149 RepID=UPI00378A6465
MRRARVIVAHRFAAVRDAGQVLFAEDGRLAEHGSIDELLARDGRFAESWRHRERSTRWRITAPADPAHGRLP